jgi:hypothetical protein
VRASREIIRAYVTESFGGLSSSEEQTARLKELLKEARAALDGRLAASD